MARIFTLSTEKNRAISTLLLIQLIPQILFFISLLLAIVLRIKFGWLSKFSKINMKSFMHTPLLFLELTEKIVSLFTELKVQINYFSSKKVIP